MVSSVGYYVFFCVIIFAVVSCQFSWIGGTKQLNLQSVWNVKGVANDTNLLASRAACGVWSVNGSAYFWGGTVFEPFEATFNDMWRLDFVDGIESWTWVSGVVNSTDHPGVYPPDVLQGGTQYFPRARLLPTHWQDSNGLLWIAFGLFKRNPYEHTSDVWFFDPDTSEWTLVIGNSTIDIKPVYGEQGVAGTGVPGGRGGISSWVDESENVWFFSGIGISEDGGSGALSDFWFLDTTTLEWTYIGGPKTLDYEGSYGVRQVANETNWPPGRFSTVFWKDGNGKFFLFGGSQNLQVLFNDVWFYVRETGLWTWVSGGSRNYGNYEFPGEVHYRNRPGSRFLSQWWVDNQFNVWVFGGTGFTADNAGVMNDVWLYHANTTNWGFVFGPAAGFEGVYPEFRNTSPNALPPRRGGANTFKFNDEEMILYAGGDPINVVYGVGLTSPFYSDMWSLNISKITYTVSNATPPIETTSTTTTSSPQMIEEVQSEKNSNTGLIVGLTVTFGLLALIAVAVIFFFLWRNQKRKRIDMNELAMENESVSNYPKSTTAVLSNQRVYTDVVIQERLGGGNFGDVFKGVWNGNTPVALKKLKNVEGLQEFQVEADMLARLKHPNIVQYFGIYVDDEKYQYIMTELMSKGSLHTILTDESASFSLFDLLGIAKQAAAGMLYLHGQKILHRDLALRNLLATDSKESDYKFLVKVADFGLSKMMKENEYYSAENKVLPYKWVALEVIKFGKFSLMSDVWSFGITIWELFSNGETPYLGMKNAEAVNRVVEGYRLPKPTACPQSLYEVMLHCWEEDPHNRPSFEEIYHKIEEVWEATKAADKKNATL